MGMIIEMFPPVYLMLGKEIENHPKLVERLQNHLANEFELRLAEVCAYCEILLDGHYDRNDFAKVSQICLDKLIKMRSPILLLS